MNTSCCRIVLTGGPGGGKTTASDLFRRELGEKVVIVPESATLLYSGGFPRSPDIEIRKSTQRAIYHVQRNLEDIQAKNFKGRVLLCDRGTLDGAAYWPMPAGASPNPSNGNLHHYSDFFEAMGTTPEAELKRYDGVIFFETAAVGGISIEGGNPIRKESLQEAIELNLRLRNIWQQHPKFVFVPHNASFIRKISFGLTELAKMVAHTTHLGSKNS